MKVDAENLREVIRALLCSEGVSSRDAGTVAEVMAEADMKGVSTHGIYFLPMLLQRIADGLVAVPTVVEVILNEGAVVHLDGGNGIGQVAAHRAMTAAIDKARQFGIGCALVRNTNHIGLLAHYSLMAAENGMVGVCLSNSAASMAPWGGAEPFFGTNPLSAAAPGGRDFPIVLDMSTSHVARGKIRKAARLNEPIPETWALDAEGNPTDDPHKALKGTLLPIGGPKGYGLALFIDLISGLISGSKYSRDITTFHEPIGPTGVGVTAIAVDIGKFIAQDAYNALIEAYISDIRNSKKARGVTKIYLPGEIEAIRERQAQTDGVTIDAGTAEIINKLLADRGIHLQLTDKDRG
jgi:LDH2 family malate/lactate/ureidoglycolate dehydrogenase